MDARDPLMVWVDRAYGCDRGDLPRGGGAVAARRGGVVFVAVGVLLAGCSSSGPKASPPTTIVSSVASTKASTVAPTPVTTVGSTSTSTTTTTLAPTTTSTTVDPKATAEAAVRADLQAGVSAYKVCLIAMPSCDPQSLTKAFSGPALDRNIAIIKDGNAHGYATRDVDRYRVVVTGIKFADGAAPSPASVSVCLSDGAQVVRPGAGPDGADVIVNDEVHTELITLDVRLGASGTWLVNDSVSNGPVQQGDQCG